MPQQALPLLLLLLLPISLPLLLLQVLLHLLLVRSAKYVLNLITSDGSMQSQCGALVAWRHISYKGFRVVVGLVGRHWRTLSTLINAAWETTTLPYHLDLL